jgi:hypothetical protein
VAMVLHVEQAARYYGSLEQGINGIVRVIRYRTVGVAPSSHSSAVTDIGKLLAYFLNMQQAYYFLAAIACMIWLRATRASAPDKAFAYSRYRLASVVLIAAFCASQSWNILAWGHMRDHLHINYITYYLPFNLITTALVGYCFSQILSDQRVANLSIAHKD